METQLKERKRNKLATASLVLIVISGFITSMGGSDDSFFKALGVICLCIAGVVGLIALKQIKKTHEKGVNLAQLSTFFGLTPFALGASMLVMVVFRNSISVLISLAIIIFYFIWLLKFFRSVSKNKV